MPDAEISIQELKDANQVLAHKVEGLEQQVKHIMDTCCSMKSFETRVKTNLLLETMNAQLTTLVEENKEIKEAIELHKKYLHIAVGVFMALQIFGIPEKIGLLIGH